MVEGLKGWAALVAIGLLLLQVSGPQVQAQSNSNCPATAMGPALLLSAQINQLNLQNLTIGAGDDQIASQINRVIPAVNSQLGINVPTIPLGKVSKLFLLIGPFNDFVTSSRAVSQSNPDSACTFLVKTFTLAAFIIVLVTGNVSGIAALNVAKNLCGDTCMTEITGNVTSFISSNFTSLNDSWNNSTKCVFNPNACDSPEFPPETAPLVAITALAVISYLLVRRRVVHGQGGFNQR